MYDSGTPTVCLGWARPSLQAKNQDVVVPLSAHTMQLQHMLFMHTLMGLNRIWGLASPPNPSEIKTTLVVYLLSLPYL